jgi:hypothetical protein
MLAEFWQETNLAASRAQSPLKSNNYFNYTQSVDKAQNQAVSMASTQEYFTKTIKFSDIREAIPTNTLNIDKSLFPKKHSVINRDSSNHSIRQHSFIMENPVNNLPRIR